MTQKRRVSLGDTFIVLIAAIWVMAIGIWIAGDLLKKQTDAIVVPTPATTRSPSATK